MEIQDDIQFVYETQASPFKEKSKSIYANASSTSFFLHPKRIEKEEKKIENNCPNFYGEKKEGYYFIMEKENGITILNANLEPHPMQIEGHYNGKIFLEPDIKDNYYKIRNNELHLLYSYMRRTHSGNYDLFISNDGYQLVITKTGYMHTCVRGSSPKLVDINGYKDGFIEKLPLEENNKSLYNAYDRNCHLIASDLNQKKLEEKINLIHKKEQETNTNHLLTKRMALYTEYLQSLLTKKYSLTTRSSWKDLATELLSQKKHCILNLETDQIIEGTFRECFEMKAQSGSIWTNSLEEYEQALNNYKLAREQKK